MFYTPRTGPSFHEWVYADADDNHVSVTRAELAGLRAELPAETFVWSEGFDDWRVTHPDAFALNLHLH